MSVLPIRRALEIALDGITPSLETSWENSNFDPTGGIPYQMVNLLFAEPVNPSIGGNLSILTRHQGIFQVSLMYPLQGGTADAEERAELISATFERGASFANGGQTVVITKTPYVTPGIRDNDRWRIAIKITFYANIFT